MTAPDWRASVVEYIRQEAQPKDKFGHQPRLYALACEIGQGEGLVYDDDILFAAAWMHDLGVFLGHRPKDPEAWPGGIMCPTQLPVPASYLPPGDFPRRKLTALPTLSAPTRRTSSR